MLAASSHLLPAVGGGDVARREVLGELVDASHLSREDYAQLLQNVGGIPRAITMALRALLSLDCSWMVWRGSEGRIIRTTCTSTAHLPVVLFFTTLSCTSESAAKSARRPLQAARALQPWRFGRMNTAGPSPAQTSGGLQTATGRLSCGQRANADDIQMKTAGLFKQQQIIHPWWS